MFCAEGGPAAAEASRLSSCRRRTSTMRAGDDGWEGRIARFPKGGGFRRHEWGIGA